MTDMTDYVHGTFTPEANEATMPVKICKCGCGEEISALNNWEYKRGHKPTGAKKSKADRKPRTAPAEAAPAETEEEDVPTVDVNMNESQLQRIWETLPLEEKAYAIANALTYERE
jgi:hypothetical protein